MRPAESGDEKSETGGSKGVQGVQGQEIPLRPAPEEAISRYYLARDGKEIYIIDAVNAESVDPSL